MLTQKRIMNDVSTSWLNKEHEQESKWPQNGTSAEIQLETAINAFEISQQVKGKSDLWKRLQEDDLFLKWGTCQKKTTIEDLS